MTQTMINAKPLLIGGEWRTTEHTLTSYNPATGAPLGTVCVGGAAEIDAAVQAARAAFPAWRAAGEQARKQALQRLHRAMTERRDEIADLINRENGKPFMEALSADVLVSLDSLAYYIKHGTSQLSPERLKLKQRMLLGHQVEVVYEPAGVVGIIAPWNVPLAIPFSQLTAALILGNTVVLKPSEWTPLIGHAIARLCVEAKLPPGVVNVVTGDGAAGAALAAHPGTQRIIFTGSVATGKKVAVACAQRLCPCVLELGGVGAALVRADADPKLAARGVVWSRFVNNGQVCVATQRVYVDQTIAQPFLDAVVQETRKLRRHTEQQRGYDVGPLINQAAAKRVHEQIADAVSKGATLLIGGDDGSGPAGTAVPPTLLSNVTPAMSVMREETFGPLLAIMPVADDAEAITQANSLSLGLAMTVWTRDLEAGADLARQLESGMVWINDGPVYYADPMIPWGGVKESGYGRTHGRWGLQALADVKVIARSRPGPRLWWFPYSSTTQRLLSLMIAALHEHGLRAKLRGMLQAILR
jgi:acyl-CoA reductase-like NAD-dependent aldehyde dehydrogenase